MSQTLSFWFYFVYFSEVKGIYNPSLNTAQLHDFLYKAFQDYSVSIFHWLMCLLFHEEGMHSLGFISRLENID